MEKRELTLERIKSHYCIGDIDVYHIGKDKIRIFPTTKEFISEKNCIALSKVRTKSILLPRYPVYQDGKYVGCATPWIDDDWLFSLTGGGSRLKQSLENMRKELLMLSSLGYDLGYMPYYASYSREKNLVFDGTYRIQCYENESEMVKKRNEQLFRYYVQELIYNGMSEFDIEENEVYNYLYGTSMDPVKRVLEALDGNDMAGTMLKEDIKKKVK